MSVETTDPAPKLAAQPENGADHSLANGLGASLLADGLLLQFDAESGSLVDANDPAIFALEMSEDALSMHNFDELVTGDRPSNDIWWDCVAGSARLFDGALKTILSETETPMHFVVTNAIEGRIALHASRRPDASGEGDAGQGALSDVVAENLGIIEYDPDGIVLSANDRAEMALEFHGEDLVGRAHDTLIPKTEAMSEEYIEFWEKLRTGRIVEGPYRHLTPQGDQVVDCH